MTDFNPEDVEPADLEPETPFIAQALQEAILDTLQSVLARFGGGMVQTFLLGVDYVDAMGNPSFIITVDPNQRPTTTAGLASLLHVHSELNLRRALGVQD